MDIISALLHKLQDVFDMAFAGALGALASLPFHADVRTFGQRVFAVGSGAAAAHYVTPLVIEYFSITTPKAGSVAFLVGLFGMSIAAAILRSIKDGIVTQAITAWLSGRKG